MKDNINLELEHKYDIDVDAIFISIKKSYKYNTSIELSNDIILDFDENGTPVALEILNTSNILGVSKSNLEHIKNIQIDVNIDEKSISLTASFDIFADNHEEKLEVSPFTANNIGIPNMETKLASTI